MSTTPPTVPGRVNRAERRRLMRATAKGGQANIEFGREERWQPDEDLAVRPQPLDTTVNVGITAADDGHVYVLGEVQNPAGKQWVMLRPDDAERYGQEWIALAQIARDAEAKNGS